MTPQTEPSDATGTSEPRIRMMTAADVPAVVELERRLFPQDAWPEQFFFQELAQAAPAVAEERATRWFWVAEDAAGIRGYAGMMCVLPLADVQTIAVAPAAQGQGLGSRLLRLIEGQARRRGASDLLLEVRADNPGAQRLYRREGFEQIHRRAGYYQDGADALIMRRVLGAAEQDGNAAQAGGGAPLPDAARSRHPGQASEMARNDPTADPNNAVQPGGPAQQHNAARPSGPAPGPHIGGIPTSPQPEEGP